MYKAGYWLGVRYWTFWATAELRNGVVHDVRYSVRLDDGTFSYTGIVTVAATSARGYTEGPVLAYEDESPDYRARSYFKWPEKDLKIVFTPASSRRLIAHAFDIQLNCLWHLRGCVEAQQVLPAAWAEKERIKSAVTTRLTGHDPCPDRILPRRVRDVGNILLVEIERSYMIKACYRKPCTRFYPAADYRL
ncbi:MAG: hypothetical protein ACRD2M_08625, partial [Terriglobales bacterium]